MVTLQTLTTNLHVKILCIILFEAIIKTKIYTNYFFYSNVFIFFDGVWSTSANYL